MGVSTLLVLVLSGISRHVPPPFGILRSIEMEKATTKASEGEIKFDEVHAYLSKGEYTMRYEEQKLVVRRRAKATNWLIVRSTCRCFSDCGLFALAYATALCQGRILNTYSSNIR